MTKIAKWGTRIGAMIGLKGDVKGASTNQTIICKGATTTVRRQRSGQQVSVLEPREQCETDIGATKQKSTNIAYVVASEDNNNSNENEKWAARPQQRLPSRGQESRQ